MTHGVTLITPTGDRREAFRLCEHWMKHQTYKGPRQWIVVDDGKQPTKVSQGQEYIRREPGASDPKHTLCLNMRTALPRVRHDRVLVIEDDDYYPPHYIERMLGWLDKADLVGEVGATYYFVKTRQYRIFTEHKHASLCRSGFTSKVLPLVLQQSKSDDWRLDLRIWERWSGSRYLYRNDTHDMSISMKGMPGRTGVTHKPANTWTLNDDNNLVQLKSWVGSDYHYYLPYLGCKLDKLLVYTVCYGGYDTLRPQPVFPGVEYVAITDGVAPEPWSVLHVPQASQSVRRASRRPKILAHEFFPGQTTLYIDANIQLKTDPRKIFQGQTQLRLFHHWERSNVNQEADAVIRYGFDDAGVVKRHMQIYKDVETTGLAWGGCILRQPGCELFNEIWWEQYQAGSMRDQLSLPYALAMSGVTYSLSSAKHTDYLQLQKHNVKRMALEK